MNRDLEDNLPLLWRFQLSITNKIQSSAPYYNQGQSHFEKKKTSKEGKWSLLFTKSLFSLQKLQNHPATNATRL